MAVTPDQAVTVFVHLAGVGGDVGRDLFFQRDRKHPSRAFAHQLIEVPDELGAALGTYYTQHRGVPSSPAVARRRTPACWSSRKVRRALIQQADPQLQVIPQACCADCLTACRSRTTVGTTFVSPTAGRKPPCEMDRVPLCPVVVDQRPERRL
jgi:hypothetical protein